MILLFILIASGIIFGLQYSRPVIGPIDRVIDNNTDLISKLAQVDFPNGNRLPNNLIDGSPPCYEDCDEPLELRRLRPSGILDPYDFFRLQGELSYQSTTSVDSWLPVSSSGMGALPGHFAAYSSWKNRADQLCLGTYRWVEPFNASAGASRICKGDGTYNSTTFNSTSTTALEQYTAGLVYQGHDLTSDVSWARSTCQGGIIFGTTNLMARINGNFPVVAVTPSALLSQACSAQDSKFKFQRIFSLTSFNNNLYLGTWSNSHFSESFGAQIWRQSGDLYQQYQAGSLNWQKVVNNGLNSSANEGILHMFSFNGKLFAGVLNQNKPAQLFVSSDGTNWPPSRIITLPDAPNNSYVSSSTIFNGAIYINVVRSGVYKSTDGATWTKVLTGGGRAITSTGSTIYVSAGANVYKSSSGEAGSFVLSAQFASNAFEEVWTLNTVGTKIIAGYGTWVLADNYGNVPRVARVYCLGCEETSPSPPKLTITLPPKLVFRPDQLRFDGLDYTVSYAASPPTVLSPPGSPYQVNIVELGQGDNDPRGNYYQLEIRSFVKRANPYQYRLTLHNNVSAADLTALGAYLETRGNKNNVYLGTGDCAVSASYEFICFNTKTAVNVPEITNTDLPLTVREKIAIPGIVVEGNVAAPVLIRDFRIYPNSLAVGGTITVRGGTSRPDYLSGQTLLDWGRISPKLDDLFNSGLSGANRISSSALNGNNYDGTTWNLNSSSSDPLSANSTTYSTPPEGQRWRHDSNLTIRQPITFSGSGTVLIEGNLTFEGPVNCASGTRLGFIAKGNIRINSNDVDCGAYTALDGSISFGDAESGSVKGIFVAKNDINLPSPTSLIQAYLINYDARFAANPTAVYRELLKIVFATSS